MLRKSFHVQIWPVAGRHGCGWISLACVAVLAALAGSGCESAWDASAEHAPAGVKAETNSNTDQVSSVAAANGKAQTTTHDAEQATAPEQETAPTSGVITVAATSPAVDEASAEGNRSGAGSAASAKDSPKPAEGDAPKYEVLIKNKEFKKDSVTGALRVSYDDIDLLKVLNMKQAVPEAPDLMPAWLKDLDGKRVRVRGFMHPQSVFQETGISRFVFCRDTGVCCFGPNPTIYYLIEVTMKKGATTHYIENRPFDVVGTFRIKLSQVKETGEVFQLYHIDDAAVIER